MPYSPTIIAHLGHSPTTTTTPSTLVSFWAFVEDFVAYCGDSSLPFFFSLIF